MKITRQSDGENFYESFSDIIFSTMAIFILLLFCLIGQLKDEQDARLEEQADKLRQEQALANITKTFAELQEKLSESTQENAQADKRQEQLLTKLQDMEEAGRQKEEELNKIEREFANAIKIDSLQLYILIDGSGSMAVPLENLSTAIRYLAEKLPNVAKDFSLSIIVYRNNSARPTPVEKGGTLTSFFDFATIKPKSDDGGRSYSDLSQFLENELLKGGGSVDPEKALITMEETISNSLSPDAKAALWLISDVGCSEIDGYPLEHSQRDKNSEETFTSRVGNLIERYPNLNFGVVFPNDGDHLHPKHYPHYSPSYQAEQAAAYAIVPTSRTFFKKLIARVGRTAHYETSSDRLLPELMLSILGEKK